MGNNEHFDAGTSEAKEPINQGIALPADKRASEWEGMGRDTSASVNRRGSSAGADITTERPAATNRDNTFVNSLKFYKEFSGKRPVGMNDTIAITHKLGNSLAIAHANAAVDPVNSGNRNLNIIASHIATAREHLDKVTQYKNGQTELAWDHLSSAAAAVSDGHSLLASTSPHHAKDVRVSHYVPSLGTHASFTPGPELAEITTPPSTFRAMGAAPKRMSARGKIVNIPTDLATRLAVNKREVSLGIKGTMPIRKDAEKAFREKISPMPRMRKKDAEGNPVVRPGYRTGSASPKSKLPLVESLGEAAVQPSKVGDFGGSEKAMPGPGSSYPRTAEKAVKNRTKARVAAARNIDINRATSIPGPSAAQERVRATRTQKPNGGAK